MQSVDDMKKNKGFSLIELIIASSIGLLAIGIVGSVFLSGYNTANKRSLELMLQQDVNDVLYLIKQDIVRAGYNSDSDSSYIISGASNIVTLWDTTSSSSLSTDADCITYAYHDGNKQYLNSIYTKSGKNSSGHSVKILRYYSTTSSGVDITQKCKDGESALDQNMINVTYFSVNESILSSSSATSRLLTINLAASLEKNSSISTAKSVQVKIRNWQ